MQFTSFILLAMTIATSGPTFAADTDLAPAPPIGDAVSQKVGDAKAAANAEDKEKVLILKPKKQIIKMSPSAPALGNLKKRTWNPAPVTNRK